MSALLELAERVERATGPDRELDCEIATAVHGGEIVWKQANYTMECYPARRYASRSHVGGFGNAPVELFTASLDAAMSLVPEGASFQVTRRVPGEGCCADIDIEFNAGGTTPALALCAAALRSRAEMSPDTDGASHDPL